MQFPKEGTRKIQEGAAKAEKSGMLTAGQLSVIYGHRLFKLLLPEQVGGLNCPLPEAAEIFRFCAQIDGSFGWMVTIGAGGDYFFGTMQQEVAREIFAPEKALIAGSGVPAGVAKRKGDGYQVSGEWKYCSGAPVATTFTFNCFLLDEKGRRTDQVRSFILRPRQVKVTEDWNAMGLQATASHTVKVEGEFVPGPATFSIFDPPRNTEQPIFNYPFLEFARISFAAVVLGLGESFLDQAAHLAKMNEIAWKHPFPDRSGKVGQLIKGQQERMEIIHARFFETIRESWDTVVKDSSLSPAAAREVSRQCILTVDTVLETAATIFPWLGMSVLFPENTINRTWRDLQTAAQHVLLRDFGEG